MCGRTALTLCAEDVQSASNYKTKTNKFLKPEWRAEYNCGKRYTSSYNIAPTDITPVLISASHFDKNENLDRVLVPMMWGMIPPWHKGEYKNHGLSTNNCRLENMLTSRLYSPPFNKGQRCVVLCEGFYEWKTTGNKSQSKTPYYIYVPQKDGIKIDDSKTWNLEWNEDDGWYGIELIKMAGLFDCWENSDGDKIYSYSVITFEANDTLSWLHHRMPAILETDKQVSDWLNFETVSDQMAIHTLKPATKLKWHAVDSIVNNSRNKTEKCNKTVSIVDENKSASSSFMQNWLNRGKRKLKDEEIDAKKLKD